MRVRLLHRECLSRSSLRENFVARRIQLSLRLCSLLTAAAGVYFAWLGLLRTNAFGELQAELLEQWTAGEGNQIRYLARSPDELAMLVASQSDKLVDLQIDHAERLSDTELQVLSRLERLQHLTLHYDGPVRIIPTVLNGSRTLESIQLSLVQQPIAGDLLQQVLRLQRLEGLDLTGTNVGDEDLSSFADAPPLKHLRLGLTKITDAGVQRLCRDQRSLVTLELTETQVTDQCVEALCQLDQLETLQLSRTQVSDNAAKQFARLTRLKFLSMPGISAEARTELQ